MSETTIKHWFVAMRKRKPNDDVMNIEGLEPIPDRVNGYYADPFILEDYLFFENYDHKKGIISCMDIKTKKVTDVLEEPWHLSYPCVFKDWSDYYMIPEAGLSKEVAIYKATSWPFKWEKIGTIPIGSSYADPQICRYKDKFYLFLTIGDDNKLTVLNLNFRTGQWSHFTTVEAMHQRSAGNIFEYKGKLLRPCQNGETCYGGGLIFKELVITETTIQEKEFSRIDPTWMPNLIGTHTFNFNDDYLVLDGKIIL